MQGYTGRRWLLVGIFTVLLRIPSTAAIAAEPAAGAGLALTAAEQAWLARHPVIRLAPDPDFPPIEFIDSKGRYRGIAADYAALVEQRLGIKFTLVHLKSWEEVLEQARRREVDMFGAASESPQRAKYMTFTKPHIQLPGVIIINKDAAGGADLHDFMSRKVGVVSGYIWQDLINNDHPALQLQPVPDLRTGLKRVSFGDMDAMVANLATASWYLQREGITNLRVAAETGYFGKYAFATRKDWPELNAILEKALADITPEEHERILGKWIHLESGPAWLNRSALSGLAAFLVLLLLAILAIMIWNRSLKTQVQQRTIDLEAQLEQRRQAEQALDLARLELERRVTDRTAELEQSNYRLQEQVDERERIQHDLERFKMTLDKTLACVFMFDAQTFRFIYVNQGAVDQVGYGHEELLNMSPFEIMPDFTEQTFRAFIAPFLEEQNKPLKFETVHQRRNGECIPVDIFLQYVVPEHESARFVATVRDISDRKSIESALNWNNRQIDIISNAQSAFITKADPRAAFELLLSGLLELTGSEYGFIGEVLYREDNAPYLRTYAITNIAWDEATRTFYEEHAPRGMEFNNLDTLFGAAMKTGEPVIANDPASDHRSGGTPPGHPPLNAFMGLPLYAGDRMVGLAGIANREEGYDEELVQALIPFTSTCASLIAEYHAEQQRMVAEERVKLSEERLRAVLDNALESIVTIDQSGIIESVNPATEKIFGFTPAETIGQNVKMLMPEPDRSAHDQYLQNYHTTREAKIIGAGREVEGRHKDGTIFPIELGVTGISVGGRVRYVGVVRDITERKQNESALLAARQELQHVNEKLREQARSDALTGIANRRYFDEILNQEMRRTGRSDSPLSLILCDIDYFKPYNDHYGHLAGDRCLQRVAAGIRETFKRAGDLCARYGGEEFAVIMPATSPGDAYLMAERLNQAVWALALPHEASRIADRLSLSVGVATIMPGEIASTADIIAAADEALYLAKANGRNRVEQYRADPDHVPAKQPAVEF
jgi:diguanylate cyclase (GGDEF)-like protein/PAS domain S-box-containing protein